MLFNESNTEDVKVATSAKKVTEVPKEIEVPLTVPTIAFAVDVPTSLYEITILLLLESNTQEVELVFPL